MSEDFYCEEALSGRTPINKVIETNRIAIKKSRLNCDSRFETLVD